LACGAGWHEAAFAAVADTHMFSAIQATELNAQVLSPLPMPCGEKVMAAQATRRTCAATAEP
jgi:hypothetical protein